MPFRNILVAHDFSEGSARALRFATELAAQVRATLDVAYVVPDVEGARERPPLAVLPGETDSYLKFLGQELARMTADMPGSGTLSIRYHVLRGDPVKRLEALAAELGSDFLCLGATGKGAIARVLLGSVSLLTLRSATLPILLVP